MNIKKLILGVPILLCATLLTAGAPFPAYGEMQNAKPETTRQEEPTIKGKVLGMSNKARTITIEDKDLGMVMLKFTNETKGLEHAQKGEAAIVSYRTAGDDRIATIVKPKLAKLPKGVTEIMPDELAKLIDGRTDFTLIDSRPAKPYAAGHIAGAVSMPVETFEEDAKTLLAQDSKDKLLVFYCGGLT